jgi:alpha-galactosidase
VSALRRRVGVRQSDLPSGLGFRLHVSLGTFELTLAFFFADWDRMLSNLGSTVPFLGAHGKGKPALSRPGAWAYPDMLEVGRLKNFTESRTHFAAWAVMSSPLILSFDLRVDKVLDDMWPIISNRDVYVHIHTPRHCAAMLRCALHYAALH